MVLLVGPLAHRAHLDFRGTYTNDNLVSEGMIIKLYLLGCLVAFGLGCYQAHLEEKSGRSIDQFGAGIVVITMMSWIYVFYWLRGLNNGGPSAC